jgi:uncharacterized membrane protein HdeD (DUF308 family)
MLDAAARHWWVLALQGVLGILFGILAIMFPDLALTTLAYIFAAWALIAGVSQVAEGYRVAEARGRSWPFAVSGVISIVAGIIAAVVPGITILGLILVLGYWLVIQGVMEVYAAWRIRSEVTNEWLLALAGAARAVVGLIILAMPFFGAVLTVSFLAVSAIFAGLAALSVGLRLRGLGRGTHDRGGRTTSTAGV